MGVSAAAENHVSFAERCWANLIILSSVNKILDPRTRRYYKS